MSTRVASISRLLHPPESQTRFLAVLDLTAYLDESGHPSSSQVFAIAGYVATSEEWDRFAARWIDVLRSYGVNEFHTVDCAHRRGAFEGWSKERRSVLYEDLVLLITTSDISGVATAVVVEDLKTVREEMRIRIDEYFLCLEHCFASFVNDAKERNIPDDEWIAYVLEDQPQFSGRAVNTYNLMKRRADWESRFRLGPIATAPKNKYVPLQAADVLAYETQLHMRRQIYGTQHPERHSFSLLAASNNYRGYY